MSHLQNKNPTILLVEDNLADVELTSIALREGEFNHTLCVVDNGEDAMAFLRQEGKYTAAPQPDLILLDLNLPGKSGLDVLKEIREDRRLSHIPIVILTVSAQQLDMWQAKEAFADLYMTKRTRLTDFVHEILTIKRFWEGYRAHPVIPHPQQVAGDAAT